MRLRGRPIQSRLRAAPRSLLCGPFLLWALSEVVNLKVFTSFHDNWLIVAFVCPTKLSNLAEERTLGILVMIPLEGQLAHEFVSGIVAEFWQFRHISGALAQQLSADAPLIIQAPGA